MTDHEPCPTCGRDATASTKADRWAAFTNDELDMLDSCVSDYTDTADIWPLEAEALYKEINAELERRKT